MKSRRNQRTGAVAVFVCILMLPLLALLALSVDYGFLLYVRTDLQRVADQAALAAVRELTPDANGNQNLQNVRDAVREYVEFNLGDKFVVQDTDIEIGRYDPTTIYTSVDLLTTGTFDTVRVAIRRDAIANQSVSLFFARLFGNNEADVSALSTAILQKARYMGPGSPVFPFAMEKAAWDTLAQGDNASIYGDGKITNGSGGTIPGNWGTIDIGPTSNSTSELSTQILGGLSQNDINSLHSQNAIPSTEHIDSQLNPLVLNADPGLSAALKHAVETVEGEMKLIPVYSGTNGAGGNNLDYYIVGWAAVEVIDSKFQGSKNTYIEIKKSFMYDASLRAGNDLSATTGFIEGAFTSPVLVE